MTKNNLQKIANSFLTSRVRVKIMELFFTNPRNEYHMREIARLIKEQINAVRRELMSMEESEFLFSRTHGIKKFFLLNPDFPFYNEFRALVRKSSYLGQEIFKNKKNLGYIKYAILSHTYLNGEKSDQYNIDLLVVGEPDVSALDQTVKKAQESESKEIFYMVLSEKELDLRKKRKDPLIYSFMVLSKGMLIGSIEDFVV